MPVPGHSSDPVPQTNEGGEVEIKTGGEHEAFKGSKSHGIESESSGWYLRSFSFVRSALKKAHEEELR